MDRPKYVPPHLRTYASSNNSSRAHHLENESRDMHGKQGPRTVTILTWNVWFNKLALEERMIGGISAKVAETQPDVILAQECTQDIIDIWKASAPWWGKYHFCKQR